MPVIHAVLSPKVAIRSKWRQSRFELSIIYVWYVLSEPCPGPLWWILSIISVLLSWLWSASAANGLHLQLFSPWIATLLSAGSVLNPPLEALYQWLVCQPSSLALLGVILRPNQPCSAPFLDQDFVSKSPSSLACFLPLPSPISLTQLLASLGSSSFTDYLHIMLISRWRKFI